MRRILTALTATLIFNALAFGGATEATGTVETAFKLYRSGELDRAKELAVKAMDEALASSDTTSYLKALALQADIAVDEGNDGEAAFFYNRCFEISGYGEPMFTLSSSLYNIAQIYYENKEYEKAMEYAVKSIDIDSNRESDSILALRYLLVSRILYEMGDYERALEFIQEGDKLSRIRRNNNVTGRFVFLKTLCTEAITSDNPDWAALEQGYMDAYNLICVRWDGYHYGTVNPYLPIVCYHLGLAIQAQGRDGKPFLEKAVDMAGTSQKMRGKDPIVAIQASTALSEILEREGKRDEAARYLSKADSLSFVPVLNEMVTKLSLSQMEFIRREKDKEIEKQKSRTMTMLSVALCLAILAVLLSLMYRKQLLQKKEIEERNAQLVKLNLQKDKLIEMIREVPDLSENNPRVEAIEGDAIPMPEISLSKREKEIIEQCCKGLISKEIASNLGISVRTVEAHKCNIFRKVGISTTNELVAFAFKSGIIK